MSVSVLSLESASVAGLEADINTVLSALLSHTILGVQIGAAFAARSQNHYQAVISYRSGAAAIATPFVLKLFAGSTMAAAGALIADYMTDHPSYFYSPISFTVSADESRAADPCVMGLLYNTSLTDGNSHFGAGGGGSAATAYDINVKTLGAYGDGASHLLTADEASAINAQFADYGSVGAAAGNEHDWAIIQGALLQGAAQGAPVYLPTGTYKTGAKSLTISYTANPIFGSPSATLLDMIKGDGLQTVISGRITAAGRGILELLGTSNGASVSARVENLRLYAEVGSSLTSCCFRVGDANCGISAYRLFCHGVNGMLLKIASSTSYAQVNSRFDSCQFWGNYNSEHWADESTCTAYSVAPESGGAFWDNVQFDSCLFSGVLQARATVCICTSCQFVTRAVRPNSGGVVYSANVFIPLGSFYANACYFEDHKYAIYAIDGSGPVYGVTCIGCEFSGVNNMPGDDPPVSAVFAANTATFGFGAVSLIDSKVRCDGYTGVAFDVQYCPVYETGSFNLSTPASDITRDYTGAKLLRTKTDGSPQVSKLEALSTDSDSISTAGGIAADGSVVADTSMSSPYLNATRAGAGSGNGLVWGAVIQTADALNGGMLGWSSTAYTTGGALPWLGNNKFFLAVPSGYNLTVGFGAASETIRFVAGGQISADGQIASLTSISAPFLTAPRIGSGAGNAEVWGTQVQTADALNAAMFGWSSTTYTTGGALAWLDNDSPFLAFPAGKTLKLGFGAGAAQYLELGLNTVYAPNAVASFADIVSSTITLAKDGADYLVITSLLTNGAGTQSANWQLSASGHLDLHQYDGADWIQTLRAINTGGFQILAGGLEIKTGANARIGTATLVAGTVTVSNTSVTANTRVRYWRKSAGGTSGNMRYTTSVGASFTLISSSGSDTSTYDWELVEEIP